MRTSRVVSRRPLAIHAYHPSSCSRGPSAADHMKSTSSSSSSSSREERQPLSAPRLLVSDSDGATVLPSRAQEISRKNSKTSLKSNASAADASNTKDEIIASMIKSRMRELEDAGDAPDQTSRQQSTRSDEEPMGRKYSRSHQRRFHRRFPAVRPDERLIDWFNCALIADILLQGYLYISDHHFAFYSNIFGYKTQFLIPVSEVVSVTKEKTARIFPNAVGICTDETKYVFGSLISREAGRSPSPASLDPVIPCRLLSPSSAYRLLQDVWRATLYQVLVSSSVRCLIPEGVCARKVAADSCYASLSQGREVGGEGGADQADQSRLAPEQRLSVSDDEEQDGDEDSDSEEASVHVLEEKVEQGTSRSEVEGRRSLLSLLSTGLPTIKQPKNKNVFVIATAALVLLLLSATFLLFRANFLYSRLSELTAETQLLG